jgi:hypothetical protein
MSAEKSPDCGARIVRIRDRTWIGHLGAAHYGVQRERGNAGETGGHVKGARDTCCPHFAASFIVL